MMKNSKLQKSLRPSGCGFVDPFTNKNSKRLGVCAQKKKTCCGPYKKYLYFHQNPENCHMSLTGQLWTQVYILHESRLGGGGGIVGSEAKFREEYSGPSDYSLKIQQNSIVRGVYPINLFDKLKIACQRHSQKLGYGED